MSRIDCRSCDTLDGPKVARSIKSWRQIIGERWAVTADRGGKGCRNTKGSRRGKGSRDLSIFPDSCCACCVLAEFQEAQCFFKISIAITALISSVGSTGFFGSTNQVQVEVNMIFGRFVSLGALAFGEAHFPAQVIVD